MRKYYLDNIRWATVLLVMAYHVFYAFNAVGVLGGVGSFREVQYQDAFLYFVYPWFMVLLFVIAGISARYALEKCAGRAFIGKRTWKLLVPSTLGLLVYQWIVGYFNIKIGGGLEYLPPFLIYPVSALSGTGPLWFAQVLWLYSLIIVWIRKMDKEDRLWKLGEKSNIFVLLLLVLPLWGGAQILNMPMLTMYRLGIYLVAFLLGYLVFSHESVQETLAKYGLPLLLVAVVTGVIYTVYYFGDNYAEAYVLKNFFTNGYAWLMVLGILGFGKKYCDRQNGFSAYMTKSSFGLYVLHYTFIVIPCYYLKEKTTLPVWIIYIAALLIVYVCTPLWYEVLRRIPVIRCLVLGIRKKAKQKADV